MPYQRANTRGDCSTREFREVLTTLKQEGCNLLVTGAVSEDVTATATRTLLGAPEEERKRILALADASAHGVEQRLPPNVDSAGPNVWIVDQRAHQRSVPRAAQSGDVDLPAPGTGDDLDRLREELVIAIDYFAETTEELEPSALRLSVSSLGWLAHEYDPDSVVRFVRSVSAMVRGVRGMAHYHLPRPEDDDLVDRLSPLFDARIELRQRDGLPTEQRWHVPEYEQTTDWVRL